METFSDEFGTTGPQALWAAEGHMDLSRGTVQALQHFVAGGPLDATEFLPSGSTRQGMMGGLYTVGHTVRP